MVRAPAAESARKRLRGRLALLDARALEVFMAIVDDGSLTRAARRLGLTQSGVSRALQELERELEVQLVDRSLRPARVTPAGEIAYRHGIRILGEMESLRDNLRRASRAALPTLRIGLVVSATAAIAPLIQALQGLANDVRVWTALTPELGQGLNRRDLDLLLTSDPMEDFDGFERVEVIREPFVLVAPHKPRLPSTISLRELTARLPLVRYTSRSIIGHIIERHLRRCRVEAPHRLELDSSASVLSAVNAGLGWAITTPLCILQGRADIGGLDIRPLPGPALARSLYVVWRRGQLPGVAESVNRLAGELLTTVLAEAFGEQQGWIMREIGVPRAA